MGVCLKFDSDSAFGPQNRGRGRGGNSTNKGMNGERVKFKGHLGKSKEPVVARTRDSGDQRRRQALEDWVGPGSEGSWMSNEEQATKGCTQDLSQPPAHPPWGHEENTELQGSQWLTTCFVKQAMETPCHPAKPYLLLQAVSLHLN